MTPLESIIKECMEEASLPDDIVTPLIRPTGAVSYYYQYLPWFLSTLVCDLNPPLGPPKGGYNLKSSRFLSIKPVSHLVTKIAPRYVFDLEIPREEELSEKYTPKPLDGEVESFNVRIFVSFTKCSDQYLIFIVATTVLGQREDACRRFQTKLCTRCVPCLLSEPLTGY
jgi:hypothetical protein